MKPVDGLYRFRETYGFAW